MRLNDAAKIVIAALTGAGLAVALGGCAMVTVVDTTASVAGTVVETGADVATAPIDLLVGDDDDEESDKD